MKLANEYIKKASLKKNKNKFCKWARLACKRHLEDLKKSESPDYQWEFSEERAQLFIDLCPHLKHWQGEWAGKPFIPEPWQRAVFGIIFGWVSKETGSRRFSEAYIEIPRKNGKSFMSGAVIVKLAGFDGEPGGQVYTAATKTDQAMIVFRDTVRMINANRRLKKKFEIFKKSIIHNKSNSVIKPLSADPKTQDGLNIHGCVNDEVHQWKGRELYDVIDTGTGSRRQPLIVNITTAGFDKENTICGKLRTKTEKILDGVIEDDSFFGIIYCADENDDWRKPQTWFKANPNLGVSKYVGKMADGCRNAENDPSALNAFQRLHLNIWTQARTLWMLPDKWKACGTEQLIEETLHKRRAFGGLDLSDTLDMSSYCLIFPPKEEGEKIKVWIRFYLPQSALEDKRNPNRALYQEWHRDGYLTITPGVAIDYNYIIRDIKNSLVDFNVDEIAYDRYGARKITNEIEDFSEGVMISMGQNFLDMNAPTRGLMIKVLKKEIEHFGNPVLTWMAANAVSLEDGHANIKLSKKESTGKIDGIIALIMALGRLDAAMEEEESAYSEHEVAVM